MAENNPILSLLFSHAHFQGDAEEFDESVRPIESQLAMDIGSKAMLATSNRPADNDFTIIEVIDAAGHAETYPDWEERLLNSFMFCRWFSKEDPEGGFGWFSRVRMIPITDEQHAEVTHWRDEDDWPHEVPSWILDGFVAFTDAMYENDPDHVSKMLECPYCHKRSVELHIIGTRRLTVLAGSINKKDGTPLIVPVADPDANETVEAHLDCRDCHAHATLEDAEWDVPPFNLD